MSVIDTVACWINYHAFGTILDLVVQRILPILSGTRSATWHWPCFTSTASYGYSTTLFCARSGISFRYYYWRLELRWYNLANRTTKPFRPDWFRLGSAHHWVHYASFARLSMFDRSSSPNHLYDCHTPRLSSILFSFFLQLGCSLFMSDCSPHSFILPLGAEYKV